jgi:hypothetical protein
MTTTDEAINAMLLEVTTAKLKAYCEERVGQGVSNEQLNTELASLLLKVNAWSARQRHLVNLILGDLSALSHGLQ